MKQNKLAVLGKENCFSLTSPTTLTYYFLQESEMRMQNVELDRRVVGCNQVISDPKSESLLFIGDHCIQYASLPPKLYGAPYVFGNGQLKVECVIILLGHA